MFKVNVATPTFMRAPGECPGTFGLECAMDELAFELKMDPIALRLANYASAHPINAMPWSTKHLKDAYRVGAERFGWEKRTLEPGSMRRNGKLLGWGMATATYPAYKMMAEASIILNVDGTVVVKCAAHDIGTGAYTVLTQISAEAIGVPVEKIKFELGSSDLPFGPVAGDSNTTATVGSAVYSAAADLHAKIAKLAVADERSSLHGVEVHKLVPTGEGSFALRDESTKVDKFVEILQRARKSFLEAKGECNGKGPLKPSSAFQFFGAQFCEVEIYPDLPQVRITRFVSVMDCGQVINTKTARSQITGGVVMAIGMALEEHTVYDSPTACLSPAI